MMKNSLIILLFISVFIGCCPNDNEVIHLSIAHKETRVIYPDKISSNSLPKCEALVEIKNISTKAISLNSTFNFSQESDFLFLPRPSSPYYARVETSIQKNELEHRVDSISDGVSIDTMGVLLKPDEVLELKLIHSVDIAKEVYKDKDLKRDKQQGFIINFLEVYKRNTNRLFSNDYFMVFHLNNQRIVLNKHEKMNWIFLNSSYSTSTQILE